MKTFLTSTQMLAAGGLLSLVGIKLSSVAARGRGGARPARSRVERAIATLPDDVRLVVGLLLCERFALAEDMAALTAQAKATHFSPLQLAQLRAGIAPFDARLDSLARLTQDILRFGGVAQPATTERFFEQGWTCDHLLGIVTFIAAVAERGAMGATPAEGS